MADRPVTVDRLDARAISYGVVLREDARLSPDGTRLAYTRQAPRPDGSRQPQVVVVDGIGGHAVARVLQRGASLARWSPDGACLALVRRVRGAERLAVQRAPHLPPADLGPAFASASEVSWSPDGSRIAVIGTAGGAATADRPAVAIVDAATGSTTWLAAAGEAADVAWSPDGGSLAVRVRHPDGYVAWIELLDAATGERELTVGGPDSRLLAVRWAPDGRSMVILGAPVFSFHPGIHRLDRTTGRLASTIDEPAPFVADLGGWVAPGRLLVHGRERARSGLYMLDVEAGRLEQVTDLAGRAWGLSMAAAGGRFATVRETAAEPPSVITGDVATGRWARVRDVGHGIADLGPGAAAEAIRVSAGHLTLDAWVLPARGPAASRRERGGPAILLVHGGPHDDLGDEWDVGVGQLLAAEGFVVGWSNPRGSTSYGRQFADAVVGHLGSELDDLVAVADALAARDDVDPARIGICGYSHGAYLAALAVTRSDRFAAAACWAPFTDLLTEWGMSDEGRGWGRRVVGADPVVDPSRYRDHSPAWLLRGQVAPTLLVHGDRDDRCPIGQSALFHELLRATGTPTRLVRVPDAGHDLFSAPRQHALVARETLGWFVEHLRPAGEAAT